MWKKHIKLRDVLHNNLSKFCFLDFHSSSFTPQFGAIFLKNVLPAFILLIFHHFFSSLHDIFINTTHIFHNNDTCTWIFLYLFMYMSINSTSTSYCKYSDFQWNAAATPTAAAVWIVWNSCLSHEWMKMNEWSYRKELWCP